MDEKQSKLLWDAVRKEDDLARAIQMAADIGESAINASIQDRIGIKAQLSELRKVISGNGDPSHSIVTRLENIECKTMSCEVEIKEIVNLLRGDLKGGESLLDKIRKQEKLVENVIKMGWIVLGIVITEVVVRLLGLL